MLAAAPRLDRAVEKRGSRLLDALDRADDRPFGELAHPVLADQLTAFDFAAASDPGHADGYHAVRVLAKRARYALELAADCLPAGAAGEYLSRLAGLQDALGRQQDRAVAALQLAAIRRAAGVYLPKSHALLKELKRREKALGGGLGEAGTAFRAWRDDWAEFREQSPLGPAPAQKSPTNPEPPLPAPLPESPPLPASPAPRPARRRAPRSGG